MAAIGTGWVDGAWVEAGWITGAWSQEAAVVVAPTADKGRDAGSGRRKQWWEGEWIIPGVTHYLPEKPPEDIVPLRPEVERLKKRLAESPRPDTEIKQELTSLARSVTGLERRARTVERRVKEAADSARIETVIHEITERYRGLQRTMRRIEARLAEHEVRVARFERISHDDEDFLKLLEKVL